jgi:hypothetical protein
MKHQIIAERKILTVDLVSRFAAVAGDVLSASVGCAAVHIR